MNQAAPTNVPAHTSPTSLPGIENLQRAPRPQTSDSSATTVPPLSFPNAEDSIVPAPDIRMSTLLTALPVTNAASPPTTSPDCPEGASSQPSLESGQASPEDQTDKVNAQPPVNSQLEESIRRVQKGKRRAPAQGRKAKRPRLGASHTNLKKPGRQPTGKAKGVRGRKASAAQGAPAEGRKKPKKTQKATKAGCAAKDVGIATTENAPNPSPSHLEVGEADKTEGSSEEIEESNTCATSPATIVNTRTDDAIRRSEKDGGANQADAVIAPTTERTEGSQQPSSHLPCSGEGDGQQKEKDSGTAGGRGNSADENSHNQNAATQKETDRSKKTGSGKQEEASLEEKYEDLSRRYLSLVRSLVESPSDKRSKDMDDSDDEVGESRAQADIIDRKLYDTIYLCKVAGMLGAMKIDEGHSGYGARNRLKRIEDPYKRVMSDGFEFVEDLMNLGMPDENSSPSVNGVFRNVHIRLVKDVWERNQDKEVAKALLLEMMTMIGNQMKEWFMKIMDGKLNLLWSQEIAVKLGEGVYKKIIKMDEEVSKKLVSLLRDVLEYISEYYQDCEGNTEKASMEKFCYSCEVSISIARSVPEAALTLDEEVAYAIGRHNGVFSHCVSRLLAEAERQGKDDDR